MFGAAAVPTGKREVMLAAAASAHDGTNSPTRLFSLSDPLAEKIGPTPIMTTGGLDA
jgi:hypothetical protein